MAAVTQKQKDEVISNFQFEGTLRLKGPCFPRSPMEAVISTIHFCWNLRSRKWED